MLEIIMVNGKLWKSAKSRWSLRFRKQNMGKGLENFIVPEYKKIVKKEKKKW